jgi:D-amino-acid dehydrogenase
MKIAIIGAGVVGVTTAHVLSQAGHAVHVYEQGSSAAQGASFAHSGRFGAAHVLPFFGPQFVKHWVLSLLGKPQQVHWRKLNSLSSYVLAMKAAWRTRRSVYSQTSLQLQRLAQYSSQTAAHYLSGVDLDYEQGTDLMVLHTQQPAFESASVHAKAQNADLPSAAKKNSILSAEQVQALVPALAQHSHLQGAIVYPGESYGNCALFTKQLKLQHQKNGVHYVLNAQVTRLEQLESKWQVHTQARSGVLNAQDDAQLADSANVDRQEQTPHRNADGQTTLFDAVIVAAGVGSLDVLATVGMKFACFKTQSYSVAFPMHERVDAPACSVLDAARGCTLIPIGNRVRVSGQHQIAAAPRTNQAAYKALSQSIQHWYPFASKVSQASCETSTSCIAIDSKPILGASRLPGLYLNFAHGPDHWALAFGCAQALADEMGNTPDRFDASAFSPARFV